MCLMATRLQRASEDGLLSITCAHKPISREEGGGEENSAEACSKLGFTVGLNCQLLGCPFTIHTSSDGTGDR